MRETKTDSAGGPVTHQPPLPKTQSVAHPWCWRQGHTYLHDSSGAGGQGGSNRSHEQQRRGADDGQEDRG